MKKNLYTRMYIVVFLVAVSIISYLSTSCTSDSEGVINENAPTQQFKTVSDFKIVGEIHNSLMSATLQNYSCSEGIQSSEQFYHELFDFEANVLDTLKLAPGNIKDILIDNFYKYRSCLHKEYLSSQSLNITRGDLSNGQLSANIQTLSEAKVLGVKESQQLYTLCDVSQKSFNSEINFEDLKTLVNDLVIDYGLTQYAQNADSGYVLAYALTIASYSLEWWENNMNDICSELSEEGIDIDMFGPDGLVQLVAADVIGGVIGGMANATVQFCKNGDHWIDMDEVGWSVLGGAVTGSIGAIPAVQLAVLRWSGFFF